MQKVHDNKHTSKKYLSLRVKSLLAFSLAFIIVFAIGFYWTYTYSIWQAKDEIQSKLLVIGQILATHIDGNMHQALVENPEYDLDEEWPLGMKDERYWKIANLLYDAHLALPQAYLYTYVPAGGDRVEIIVSHGSVLDPVDGAYFKQVFVPGPESSMLQGLEEVTLSKNIVEDQWGTWLSVFIPITNDQGEIVGALGMDYLASEIFGLQKSILRSAVPIFFGIYFVFFFLTLAISNELLFPIHHLTQAASRLGQGDLSTSFDVSLNKKVRDESDLLAETLSLMVDNILERDKQIREVLAEQQDFIIRLDREYKISYVNSIFCNAFGQDKSVLSGKSFNVFVHKPDRLKLQAYFTEILPTVSEQAPQSVLEVRMRLFNRDIRWIQWSFRALFGQDGTLNEYQAVGRDITDLKSLQAELQLTNNKLKQLSHQLLENHENEVKKLAQHLHDQVLSNFAALVPRKSTDIDNESFNEIYQKVVDLLRQTIYELRSPMLSYGLYYAIEDYLEDFANKLAEGQNLVVDLEASDVRYDDIIETQIFRMVQEACTNVRKHAEANTIKVSGKITQANLYIKIEDDGIGFTPDSELSSSYEEYMLEKHFGLAGMLERADLIGAVLKIKSEPGIGSVIEITYQSEKISA